MHRKIGHVLILVLILLVLDASKVRGQVAIDQYGQMRPKARALFDGWAAGQRSIDGRAIDARTRFSELSVSRRSTFAAVTNALLFQKITDPSGKVLGAAIDLVDRIDEIAGQEPGKGSDEQFRLYVTLKPRARGLLELSREFQHGKDNTIFHKGFPINYRQGGSPPTLQFSLATDEVRSDIDVDYRSSSFPSALFNGHLSASNSDVRAEPNYQTHLRRWPGLIDWWDEDVPDLVAEFLDTKSRSMPQQFAAVDEFSNAGDVSAISETAHLFFQTWLVQRDPGTTMGYLRSKLTFCSDMKESKGKQLLEKRKRLLFYDTIIAVNKELKKPKALGNAMRPVAPVDPFIKAIDHKWKDLFTLATITDGDYNHFVCSSRTSENTARNSETRPRTFGNHFITKFQFALENGKGGILRLMWANEDGKWKIEAFDAVTA